MENQVWCIGTSIAALIAGLALGGILYEFILRPCHCPETTGWMIWQKDLMSLEDMCDSFKNPPSTVFHGADIIETYADAAFVLSVIRDSDGRLTGKYFFA